MSELDEALATMSRMTAVIKVDNVIKERGFEDKFEALTKQFSQDYPPSFKTAADRLRIYKEAIGEDMFAAIAENPNLQQMADTHCQEVAKRVFNEFIDTLMRELFEGSEVTRKDLLTACTGALHGDF